MGAARTATLGVSLAGLTIAVTPSLISHGVVRMVALIVVAAGVVALAWTRRTGLALAILMLYLGLLDGFLKLASGSSSVALVRDALLYAIVAGVLVRGQVEDRRLSLPPLSGWILAYVAFVLVQIANPSGGTFVHSLAGVKPHLEFVPLFFLGYLVVRDAAALRKFVLLLLVIGAANGVVGYVQFQSSPQQLASWGPGYSARVLGTGTFTGGGSAFVDSAGIQRVRPFGLGSDIGAGGAFGVLALGGIFALGSFAARIRDRLVAAILSVGAVAAIVTSEGRGVIVAAAATVLAYGVMTATSSRRLASLAGFAVAAVVAYFVVTAITSGAGGGAFRYQGLSASKIATTTTSNGGRPGQLHAIADAAIHYPLGAGLGTGGPATVTAGASPLTGKLNTESEFSFLVVETGIPGLLAVIGFTIVVLGLGLARCRSEPDLHARVLLAAVISPLLGMLISFYAGPGTVTVPDGPLLWFVGGIVAYWMITLPRERAGLASPAT
ncbi:MAG: hypothetical protein QOH12_3359 [Solirubrobacteraceae bacterium]|nr:hypothetical protein [Solirubrobacteraceae bacterium]